MPSWKNDILTFSIPSILEKAYITLYALDNEKLITVGSSEVDLRSILLKKNGKFSEELSNDSKITGNLEFCTSIGSEPQF